MNESSKAASEKSVLSRLIEIADHFALRDNLCSELPSYKKADTEPQAPKRQDFANLLASIQAEEIAIFQKLVALKDNVERYFAANGLNKKEIEMIAAFKPFQLALHFIKKREQEQNGTPPKGSYYSLIFKNDSSLSAEMTPVVAYVSFAGADGDLFPVVELILDLLKIWDMFLLNHTEIDIKEFENRILNVKNRNTVHSAPLPREFMSTAAKAVKRQHTTTAVSDKRKITLEKDIIDRLNTIAFHFEERDTLSKELKQYKGADLESSSARYENLKRLLTRIEQQEVDALYELVHLQDNVKKYLVAIGSRLADIKAIDEFRSFRVAANYVNTHKHGIRGRNAKSAKHDYTYFFFDRKGDKSSPDDPIVGVGNVINYDGSLTPATDIILNLIIAWEMFIKYHTQIDIFTFNRRIEAVRLRHQGEVMYSTPIPDGLTKDAKRLSDERKKLDIL